ncbi:MAG TPA: TetR family transcriptional regulator [Ktedonosporobacter sp.]|nr:TetR family transcriptional regulator [Ktedonosporobacter sp.]
MTEETLTPDRILNVAEDVLRRFGPAKATVIDVARALGVSHGSVYRHFSSKAALREAVTERWLARLSAPLATIITAEGSASERLHHWLHLLFTTKRQSAHNDPELFATYVELADEATGAVIAHVNDLVAQIAHIIADGVAQGEFAISDPTTTARAVFYATNYFHNPAHASGWSNPSIDAAFESVWTLILHGLSSHKTPG